MEKLSIINFVYSEKVCSFTAEISIFRVLKFPKVRYVH